MGSPESEGNGHRKGDKTLSPLVPQGILAIDPGQTSGWAYFRSGVVAEFGQILAEDFKEWLRHWGPDRIQVLVCEDYFIRPKSQISGQYEHIWNNAHTARVIGMTDYHCYLSGIKFVLQQPSSKVMGYRLLGKEYKKGKAKMHHWDAMAHGKIYVTKCEAGKG